MRKRATSWGGRLLACAVWSSAAVVATSFLWLLADLVWHGPSQLSWEFLTEAPESAGTAGGIAPILASTVLILAVALAAAVPLGLASAIWLSEFTRRGGPYANGVGFCLDVLAGVPSIVFGLFGNALFCVAFGLGFSILSGGLTLACMMLPMFARTAGAGLSAVAEEWRRGAAALGLSRYTALTQILLPAAAPALTAGLMLGIGRALAETAALIFTSGYVDRTPESLFDSGRALSIHIYDLSMNVTGGDAAAYGSALVLIAVLALVNATAMGCRTASWRAGSSSDDHFRTFLRRAGLRPLHPGPARRRPAVL